MVLFFCQLCKHVDDNRYGRYIRRGINFIKLSRLENSIHWAYVWRFTRPLRYAT